jgi:hypothetical protein
MDAKHCAIPASVAQADGSGLQCKGATAGWHKAGTRLAQGYHKAGTRLAQGWHTAGSLSHTAAAMHIVISINFVSMALTFVNGTAEAAIGILRHVATVTDHVGQAGHVFVLLAHQLYDYWGDVHLQALPGCMDVSTKEANADSAAGQLTGSF